MSGKRRTFLSEDVKKVYALELLAMGPSPSKDAKTTLQQQYHISPRTHTRILLAARTDLNFSRKPGSGSQTVMTSPLKRKFARAITENQRPSYLQATTKGVH